jgi:predicted transcriptional regulator
MDELELKMGKAIMKVVLRDADYQVIESMGKAGWDKKRIAEALEITEAALSKLMKSDARLEEAIKNGVELSSVTVANALYRKAIGYDYWEEHYEKDSEGELSLKKKIKKHSVPDTFAANALAF